MIKNASINKVNLNKKLSIIMNFKNLLLPLLAEFILLNSQEITDEFEVTSSMNGTTSFYEGIQNNILLIMQRILRKLIVRSFVWKNIA